MKINKEILALAIPNIISNISVPLISTVDTALMGRMSELHLGAIGLGAMIFNFLYWNFGFLRMGTTGLTAQAFGADNETKLVSNLAKAALVGLLMGLIFILLRDPLYSIAEYLLNISSQHKEYVHNYFDIRIHAAPASLMLFALMGWLFGMQNSLYPLYITVVINLSNIFLSYYFVTQLEWGIMGAARGTVIAQYIGLLFALTLILIRYRPLLKQLSMNMISKIRDYKEFFHLNKDIFIRTLFLSFAFGFFYSQSSNESEIILAINVVLLQFLNWMSYIIDGFAYATEALVGKYIGKQNEYLTTKTIKLTMAWGFGMAMLFSLSYGFFGDSLLQIFTDEMSIIRAADPYMTWMIFLPILGFACYIWDGVYIGMTASKAMRNSMIIAFIGYIGIWFLSSQWFPTHSLWIALISFLFLRGLIQTYLYYKYRFELT